MHDTAVSRLMTITVTYTTILSLDPQAVLMYSRTRSVCSPDLVGDDQGRLCREGGPRSKNSWERGPAGWLVGWVSSVNIIDRCGYEYSDQGEARVGNASERAKRCYDDHVGMR